MKNSGYSTDKVFAHAQYTIYYRNAPSIQWTSEARHVYTVLFLLKGKLRWEANDAKGELHGRDTLLAVPGETVSANGERTECLDLTLAPAFVLDCAVRARLTRADAHITFRARAIEHDERLARLAHDLTDELREEAAGQELVVTALIEQTIVHLLRRYANIRRSDELELSRAGLVDRRIRRAVELMHAHMDRDLPLEEIAAAAYLSPFHFARLFKKLTGTTPHAYLASLRTAHAQTLLAQTDLSITQVGARVGYASPSHFTKAFRQATGLTPRAFRAALIDRGQRSEVRGQF